MIDSHCHLQYDYEAKSVAELIAEAHAQGVTDLVTVGTDLASSLGVQKIANEFAHVYFTAGVHPHDTIDMKPGDLEAIRQIASDPKCRAIGEIGLDYHYDHSPRDVQIARLDGQLDLACELKLPVVIHSREAETELLKSLARFVKARAAARSPGVIHCFTGTRDFGLACINLGFYISFSGILTFKNARDLRDCAKEFPLDRILIETDSPFLAPIPFRGRKCEPAMITQTAQKLAEVRGVDLETVVQATRKNTQALFDFS